MTSESVFGNSGKLDVKLLEKNVFIDFGVIMKSHIQ